MISALSAAKYLASVYRESYGENISEMKLHKLLYFAQREALIDGNTPLFSEVFEGWRFGPVIPEIRHEYADICVAPTPCLDSLSKNILDESLRRYGSKDPWSLSRLSHGEYSWQRSREGISEYQNSNNDIKLEDIRIDAQRVRVRRKMLNDLKN